MAVRTLIRTGLGMIAQLSGFKSFQDVEIAIQILISVLNGNLSLGNGINSSLAGNLSAQYIDFTFAAANTEYEIPWSLARVAVGYDVVRRSAACHIYDSNSGAWSPTALLLKSDTAGVTVKLRVF